MSTAPRRVRPTRGILRCFQRLGRLAPRAGSHPPLVTQTVRCDQVITMFTIGEIYNRREAVHEVYGGQQQGGISTPTKCPYVFLFTGESGKSYGYADKFQPDGTFWYTGEGQAGDMGMVRGNLAIRDHQENRKSLFLFEYVKTGYVRFIGEAVCIGYHTEQQPDVNGNYRNAIIFHLALITLDRNNLKEPKADYKISTKRLKSISLAELRDIALAATSKSSNKKEIKTLVAIRSEAIKIYALKRANGTCEGCGNAAPFSSKDGPFLEVHHMERIADGGPDHPENVAALCPNCHKRVHFGIDGEEYNRQIWNKIRYIEGKLS